MIRPILWIFLAVATVLVTLQSSAVRAHEASAAGAQRTESRDILSPGVRNPSGEQEEAVAAGRKLYKAYCAHCHGVDARGRDRARNLHAPSIQNLEPEVLFLMLRNGKIRKGMPSWSRLPDQQLWQITAYLKTLR